MWRSLTDSALLLPRDVHGEVRHLGTDPHELAEVVDVVRDVGVVVPSQDLGRLL